MPLIDPTRVKGGEDTSKTGVARKTLFTLTPFLSGLLYGTPGYAGQTVEVGDILPGLQEAASHVTRPNTQAAQPTNLLAGLTRGAAQDIWKPTLEKLTAPGTDLGAVTKGLASGAPEQTTQMGMELAQAIGPTFGAAGAGATLPQLAPAVGGVPQAVMELMSMPSAITEHMIGGIEQRFGVDINPAQMIVGGQTIPTIARGAAEVARLVGANDVAAELEKHTNAPPSVLANLVANVIARQRNAGQDSKAMESVLNTLLDTQSLISRPNTEQVIQRQSELIKGSVFGTEPATPAETWRAAEYTYEGTPYILEARQRLEAGEDWNQVYADIDEKMAFEGRVYDIVGQLVLDPLNASDVLEKMGVEGVGLGARLTRWESRATRELIEAAPEGAGLARLAANAGDVEPLSRFERFTQNIPGLRWLVARTPETLAKRRSEEAARMIQAVVNGVSPQAGARLAAENISEHPLALALEAFMHPAAADIAGTGRSAEKIRELVGLPPFPATDDMIRRLGLAPGAQIDLFNSASGQRTRDFLGRLTEGRLGSIVDEFQDVQKIWRQAGLEGAVEVTKAGKTVTLRKADAVEAAEEALAKWLGKLDEAMTEAIKAAPGYQEPPGLVRLGEAAHKKLFAPAQGIFAQFHIRTNPGFNIRQFFTNDESLILDGINVLTPMRNVDAEIARLGLFDPGIARQTFGVFGMTENVKLGGKFDLARGARNIESRAGRRAFLEYVQRTFRQEWRVGRQIPERAWAELEQVLGPGAGRIRALVENARTPQELNDVVRLATENDPWRLAADTALEGTEHTGGALAEDLRGVVNAAGTPEEAIQGLERYAVGNSQSLLDFLDKAPPVPEGSFEAMAMQAVEDAVSILSPNDQARFLDGFVQDLLRQDARSVLAGAYVQSGLDELAKLDPEAAYKLERQFRGLEQTRRAAMAPFRQGQARVWGLIDEGKWDELRQFAPEFQFVNNRNGALNAYREWASNFWRDTNGPLTAQFEDLYEQIGTLVTQAGGPTLPRYAMDEAGQVIDIERVLPATASQQRIYWAHIMSAAESRGFDIGYVRNILIKDKLLDADRFFWSDIVNQEWHNRAIRALLERPINTKRAPEVAGEFVEKMIQEIEDAPPLVKAAQPADMIANRAVLTVDREMAVQRVIDEVARAGKETAQALNAEQVEALKAYIRDLDPRMASLRTVAAQVGAAARDFALTNPSDRRGFDLLTSMLYNYPHWYEHTLAHMVTRAMDTPGRIAALIKLRMQIRRINRNLPEWWQDQIGLQTPFGPVYINPLASVDQLNGFLGDKFRDPDMYGNPLSATMAEAQQFGPGLHGLLATLMALRAWAMGNKEEALGWMGNLGPVTRGVNAITVLAKQYGGAATAWIPPGGVVVEPWLWNIGEGHPAQMVGSKYDAKRVGKAIWELVGEGRITPEEGYDAMLYERGEAYDLALQRSKENTAWQVLASWLFGAGIKPRLASEIDIQRMDAERVALAGQKETMSPEQWRQAWAALRDKYPWMDYVQGFRRDPIGRANIYAWSVFDRMPPNPRPYFTAMGLDPDIYSDLMNKFYKGKGLEKLSPLEQEQFMNMMKQMGAILALQLDPQGRPTAIAAEWEIARQARRAMYERLEQQFAGADDLQTQYYALRNSGEPEAAANAAAFLEGHGQLQEYWDAKDQMVAADPLLSKYWGSMDVYEQVATDQFETRMERQRPGLHAALDEYYRLKETDPEGAADYLSAHPELSQYWSARDEWTLQLDVELRGMAAALTALAGEWGSLREPLLVTTLEQRRLADLIASGSRPLGDFELPEDLDAKMVRASIKQELDSIPEGSWGALYRQLKQMGDLDQTLRAFQEWGGGKSGIDTIQAHLTEVKALLAALGQIREDRGWTLGDAEGNRTKPLAGGGGGGTRPQRVRSRTWGGATQQPQTEKQMTQLQAKVDNFMAQLQESAPTHWGMLRNLADMDAAAAGLWLEEQRKAGTAFYKWYAQLGAAYPLYLIMEYFRRMLRATATKRKRRMTTGPVSVRYSIPAL